MQTNCKICGNNTVNAGSHLLAFSIKKRFNVIGTMNSKPGYYSISYQLFCA